MPTGVPEAPRVPPAYESEVEPGLLVRLNIRGRRLVALIFVLLAAAFGLALLLRR